MRKIGIAFVELDSTLNPRDNIILRALKRLYGNRLEVIEGAGSPDVVFYGDAGKGHLKYDCKRVYVAQENKMPNFRVCDYALSYLELPDERNLRVPFYVYHFDPEDLVKKGDDAEAIFARKTKFCSFIVSNASRNRTSERIAFFEKLSRYKRVDSGGKLLNNLGFRVGNKREFLKDYKFNIAFENRAYSGYTSEKIVDAMEARSMPIYWGDPDVGKRDFNSKSFVFVNEFKSFDEAVERVVELDRDDSKYLEMLKQPYFHGDQVSEFFSEERLMPFLEKVVESKQGGRTLFDFGDIGFNLKKNLEPYLGGKEG